MARILHFKSPVWLYCVLPSNLDSVFQTDVSRLNPKHIHSRHLKSSIRVVSAKEGCCNPVNTSVCGWGPFLSSSARKSCRRNPLVTMPSALIVLVHRDRCLKRDPPADAVVRHQITDPKCTHFLIHNHRLSSVFGTL